MMSLRGNSNYVLRRCLYTTNNGVMKRQHEQLLLLRHDPNPTFLNSCISTTHRSMFTTTTSWNTTTATNNISTQNIHDRINLAPKNRNAPIYMSTEATTASYVNDSSTTISKDDDRSTTKKHEQYLYMWGTDQFGTIFTPKDESTTTSNTASSPPAAAAANTTQKYDTPTWMDPISWKNHQSDSSSSSSPSTNIDQVICGPTETAIILSNGLCYVTGKNEYGQLGMNHTKPILTPTGINTNFDAIYDYENENCSSTTTNSPQTKIRHVAFGTNFAAYLVEPPITSSVSTKDMGYDLYTCGFGGSTLSGVGCLGHGTIDSTTQPKLVESIYEDNVYVRQVVAGDAHCTILTNEHEILTTGSGSYGRLGNFDTTDQLYFEPVEMVLPSSQSHIVQIAGGKSFTLALTNDGVVYGWGRNHKGQLGTGLGLAVDMYAMQSVPEPISDTSDLLMNTTIVKIAAGHSHAACLSESGEVYNWGMSLHLEPVLVDSLLHTKIVDIVCGQNYTFAIDVHGHMYSFGNGNYTLGHGKDTRQLNEAKKIESFRTGIEEIKQPDGSNSDNAVTKLIQRKIVYAAAGWKHAAVLLQEELIEKPEDYSTII